MKIEFINIVHERNDLPFIFGTIADQLNVNLKDLFSKDTRKTGADAKNLFYFFAVRMCGHKLRPVTEMIKRDHSTVLHGIQTATDLLQTDPQFFAKYLKILKTLEHGIQTERRTYR